MTEEDVQEVVQDAAAEDDATVWLLPGMAIPPALTATRALTAGVVCFSVAPATQTLYLLLGQERNDKWCDFGGHLEAGEVPAQGAAREFCEESLCVLHFDDGDDVSSEEHYLENVCKHLLADDYFVRLEIACAPKRKKFEYRSGLSRFYFVKQIPWQPEAPARFAEARELLVHSGHVPAALRAGDEKTLLEKVALEWWSVDRLRQVLRNDGKHRDQRFRRSFLPALGLVLSKLTEQ